MSDRLLQHYLATLKDRQTYWLARDRAKTVGDILVLAIDSYDRAKVTLPRFPFKRTPKKPVYDQIKRALAAFSCDWYSENHLCIDQVESHFGFKSNHRLSKSKALH